MSQTKSKKLTPNLDQQCTKALNLTVLQRIDPSIDEILFTAAHVSFYDFNIETSQWSRKDVEGTLFVVKRNSQPEFQFIVMNRRSTDNLVENLLDFEYELNKPYLLYRNASQDVVGIWFYNSDESEEVANLFNRILKAYPKAPPNTITPTSKSESEELNPVVPVITGSPLESSSAAASATDAPENTVLKNFIRTLQITGLPASNAESFIQPYHSATVTSTVPSGLMSPVPAVQMPSASLEAIYSSNQVNNLYKPSTFLAATSSSLLIPPISLSVPPSAAVHNSMNLPRQHGTPLLQPFPPPNPPVSFTPIPSSFPKTPVLSRDKIRDALSSLVQDDIFIDMVFQKFLKVQNS